ncbi:hypothetical protein IWW46_004078 [Coemansia sp. RSA 2440]|nr:hypothetical protein IWW46_004078 [Coemansia sp. RSA 2440]
MGSDNANASCSLSNDHVTGNGFGSLDGNPIATLLSAPASPLLADSSLIPPSLQSSTISSALAPNGDLPAIDDTRPLSSLDDYSAVSQEARMHWIARRKQSTSVYEQVTYMQCVKLNATQWTWCLIDLITSIS